MSSSHWPTVAVADLKAPSPSAIAIGPFGSRMKSDLYTPSGIPVVRGTNISDAQGFEGDFVYVSEATADELSGCNVYEGDLVFPHRGAIGRVGIVTGMNARYVLSTSMMKLTCNKALADARYLFYFFRSASGRHELLKNASQVGTPGIATPLTSLKAIRVPLPPLSEQRLIARILGALDAKIELNRRTSRSLEMIAGAVFRSWFVDRDSMGVTESVSSGGMSRDWSTAEFGDLVVAHQDSVAPSGIKDEIVDHYSIPAFDEGKKPSVELGANIKSNKLAVRACSVLISRLNPRIPRVWLPRPATSRRGVCSTEFMVLSPRPPFTREYLYELLRSDAFHEEFLCRVTGTSGSHQRVKPHDAMSIPVASPPQGLVEDFSRLVRPLLDRVDLLCEENDSLANLRDAFLPRLLDGSLSSSHGPREAFGCLGS